ncbi:hypothetical protein HD842_004025 [Massilia aurea]|uniref:PRTase-CE domain-containing protein n=1 Tax=Massilia aurea TaxID=373040 RepID=A0A7W9X3J7_9BURK|nr:hypothetical protein [Massilia aurea]MBB6135848.1 hypothetical protein [Massilia aurea]
MENDRAARGHFEKWDFFRMAQLWPRSISFDPQGWIKNFESDELPYALRLLEGFTYYSDELVQHLFRTAFQNISQIVVKNKENYFSAVSQWTQFVDSLIVVRVEGRDVSDADTSYIFPRYARDVLGLQPSQILSPSKALERLRDRPRGNVVFVGDFVGTGEQFEEMWNKIYTLEDYSYASFNSLTSSASAIETEFFYCPLIATEIGRDYIKKECPLVKLVPAHLLPENYSVLSNSSTIWRDDMCQDGPKFIATVSERAGLSDLDGRLGCWKGYGKLGLALAFAHGWPDAILPIFTLDDGKWTPLLKKGFV